MPACLFHFTVVCARLAEARDQGSNLLVLRAFSSPPPPYSSHFPRVGGGSNEKLIARRRAAAAV